MIHHAIGSWLPRRMFALLNWRRQEQGLDIIGWYHSHPDHPARPSEYDRDHAWPWYSYIIVSVNQGRPEEMTSWRLHDDRQEFSFEEIEIRQHVAI